MPHFNSHHQSFRQFKMPNNPIVAAPAVILGLGLIALLFWLGLMVGLILLIAGALATAYWRIKAWWQRRKNPNQPAHPIRQPKANARAGHTLEGEYDVVSNDKDHH